MKKLGIVSIVSLAMALSALPAQAAQPVRAGDSAVWGPTSMLPAGSVAGTRKASKVSYMTTDTGTLLGAGGLILGATGLGVALGRKRTKTITVVCLSPGGSCQTVQ